jgi:hypothetical protein
VIDELGYLPLDRHRAEHLLGFYSQCYKTTSLIVTTNLPFADPGGLRRAWRHGIGDHRGAGRHATLSLLKTQNRQLCVPQNIDRGGKYSSSKLRSEHCTTPLADNLLADLRTGGNIRHIRKGLLRQRQIMQVKTTAITLQTCASATPPMTLAAA